MFTVIKDGIQALPLEIDFTAETELSFRGMLRELNVSAILPHDASSYTAYSAFEESMEDILIMDITFIAVKDKHSVVQTDKRDFYILNSVFKPGNVIRLFEGKNKVETFYEVTPSRTLTKTDNPSGKKAYIDQYCGFYKTRTISSVIDRVYVNCLDMGDYLLFYPKIEGDEIYIYPDVVAPSKNKDVIHLSKYWDSLNCIKDLIKPSLNISIKASSTAKLQLRGVISNARVQG